jgi:Zn-dependent protease with chaperone function
LPGEAALILLTIALALMSCTAKRYWPDLPPARPGVLAYYVESDPAARRAALIARQLSAARPLPVDRVLVASSGFLNAQAGFKLPDNNAGAFRCGSGYPPPSGCVYVGNRLLTALSDDALAGVLAHELGHLERGHRRPTENAAAKAVCQQPAHSLPQAFTRLFAGCGIPRTGPTVSTAVEAYESREIEWEADEAAIDRLAAAGYCAGPLMRETFGELSNLFPEKGTGGLLASHPGYAERWKQAGAECSPRAR